MAEEIFVPQSVRIIQSIVGWDPSSKSIYDMQSERDQSTEDWHGKNCKKSSWVYLVSSRKLPIKLAMPNQSEEIIIGHDFQYDFRCEECGAMKRLHEIKQLSGA